MARCVFYSFHYDADNARASQVRNMGVVEGNRPASDNDWEKVKKGGDSAIQAWIDGQLVGKSCAVVLIGSGTKGRKWIKYEIKKAWDSKKGLVGVYVHNLKDLDGKQTLKGGNPFADFTVGDKTLSTIVKAYDPPYADSKLVYAHIKTNFGAWIEEAIKTREQY